MTVQDSNPHEDNLNNLETTENSVYTDDYQTEDAFSQIPVLNEFVEEETQEISSVPSQTRGEERPTPQGQAFPAIERFHPPKEPPKKQPRIHRKKKLSTGEKAKVFRPLKNAFAPKVGDLLKSLERSFKKSSREILFVSLGTLLLSACLIILGFISLHV